AQPTTAHPRPSPTRISAHSPNNTPTRGGAENHQPRTRTAQRQAQQAARPALPRREPRQNGHGQAKAHTDNELKIKYEGITSKHVAAVTPFIRRAGRSGGRAAAPDRITGPTTPSPLPATE